MNGRVQGAVDTRRVEDSLVKAGKVGSSSLGKSGSSKQRLQVLQYQVLFLEVS